MLHFLTYPALVSVTAPLLVLLFLFSTRRVTLSAFGPVWFVGTVLSMLTARWSITEDTQQLFILPVVGIWFLIKQLKIKQNPVHAWTATFTSFFIVDVMQAFLMRGVLDAPVFYYGVGGAGLFDGLVVFPLLVCGIIAADNKRK